MSKQLKLVIFQIDEQRFALPVNAVERVIQIVEFIRVPKAPEFLMGMINMHGQIIPVLNFRVLFQLRFKEIELTDQLVIVETPLFKQAIWVDKTTEIIDLEMDDFESIEKIKYGENYFEGIAKLKNETIIINDPTKFLNRNEWIELSSILKKSEYETEGEN